MAGKFLNLLITDNRPEKIQNTLLVGWRPANFEFCYNGPTLGVFMTVLEKLKQSKPSGHGESDRRGSADKSGHRKTVEQITNCKWCGGSHSRRNCPAYGKRCTKCGKPNYFEKICDSEENVVSIDTYVIHSLSDRQDSQRKVELMVNDYPITFKVDTCASCIVLSRH